ncbi:site-specific integrase [Variovorax sp. LjRoot130]|uniref:tyrosine-type recombinase/integrase n=1 Tax=Variovorax sp. LjRoot130 TaxID=3342261 RepID=UPI003ED03050
MATVNKSAGDGSASDSALQTGTAGFPLPEGGLSFCRSHPGALPVIPMRAGDLTVEKLVDLYMAHYAGRDTTRLQRLSWWVGHIGGLALQDVTDDHVHAALEGLSQRPATYYAGLDAAGRPIYKAKRKAIAPATINRYNASIAAVFTWAIKRRVAPKGWVHPCRSVERRAEHNEKTRFLSEEERVSVLEACKASCYPRLYLLVLTALTTGARKGELLGLRWQDIDYGHNVAYVGRSKNGDPKTLPLVPAVVDLLKSFGAKAAPSSLVFASARNPAQPYAFEERWKEALRAAKVRNFRFHDLRHTCASMLAQNGATLLEIGDLLGHRQLQVTKRYSHLATGHKAALVNRVLGGIQ